MTGEKQQHADSPVAILQQRKTRAGSRPVFLCKFVPKGASRIGQEVIHDARLSCPERCTGQTTAFRGGHRGCVAAALHAVVVQPFRCSDSKELPIGVHKRDGRGGEGSSQHRGFAHQFEQLCPRFDPHDRFVGRAEGFKHLRQAVLLFLGFCLFVGPIEVPQGE